MFIAALLLATAVGLEPQPIPEPEAAAEPPATAPGSMPGRSSAPPGSAAVVLATAAAVVAGRGKRSHETGSYVSIPESAASLEPPPDAVVVFVPGHGTTPEVFDVMIDLMGLEAGQVEVFDYGWVDQNPDAVSSSSWVPTEDAANALSGYLHGLGVAGRPIYLVGFSKGGATLAELIAEWDGQPSMRPDGVYGAALIDPPIASGAHGVMQSLGALVGPLPDDGGYDPVECHFLGLACHDTRENLGQASGVEVVAFRNPMSGLANFVDEPEGMRSYDVPDHGPPPDTLSLDPVAMADRISEAHNSTVHSPVVAACIVQEMNEPGSCDLSPPVYPAAGVVGAGLGTGGGQIGNKIL